MKTEQMFDHVAGRVLRTFAEEGAEAGEFIAACNDGAFIHVVVSDLRMADVREQPVTQALPPFGVLDLATTFHVRIDRLGRAAVPQPSALLAIRGTEIAQVTAAFATLGPRVDAFDLDDLERIPRGRGARVGPHADAPLHNAIPH